MQQQAPVAADNLRVRTGIALTVIAGYIDAATYLQHHIFTANMTGNTVVLGILASRGMWHALVTPAGTILAFIMGSFVGEVFSVLAHRRLAYVIEAAIIIAGTCIPNTLMDLCLLALAMGLQNASASRFGNVVVNTSFISGNYSRLGKTLADIFLRGDDGATRRLEARTLAVFLAVYLIAGCVGAYVSHVTPLATLVPVIGLLALAAARH